MESHLVGNIDARGDAQIYLSPPDVTDVEIEAVTAAIRSGWVAPLGPDVDEFERRVAKTAGRQHAVGLNSGTAALHLGLKALGVGSGDQVVMPTVTFAATAFAAAYLGADLAFVDVEDQAWTMDPQLLSSYLQQSARQGHVPAAVVPVDVFGRTCDYEAITEVAARYEVPVLWDSAEAMGAECRGMPAGSMGDAAIFSFNGNKIMTTSGGGMLVTDDSNLADRVRYWSAQAREPVDWYEHHDIGYNYRLSNILAALGNAQLSRLPTMIESRRRTRERYRELLGPQGGLVVRLDAPWGRDNAWLTLVGVAHASPESIVDRLLADLKRSNMEGRRVWKPLHRQPVFQGCKALLSGVADRFFSTHLCLPSGSALTDADIDRVSEVLLEGLS